MPRFRFCSLLLLLFAGLVWSSSPTVATETTAKQKVSKEVQSVAQSNNQFAFDLYQELRSKEGNLFFSPMSISTALSMTYAGAEGETKREIANVLRFKLPGTQVHLALGSLMTTLNTPEKNAYELRVANRLWGQKGYGFLPQFLATTRKEYGAELAQVDFANEADQARQDINNWVEEQTNDKIKDLIPQGAVNELTRLVLTNAIYFKGKWEHPFEKKQTKDAPFALSAKEKINAPLMFQKEKFKYGENEFAQLLEMRYTGDNLSMLVLLPKKSVGLSTLEKNLNAANVDTWSSRMRKQEVKTYIPRFKLAEEIQLNSMLSSLGMPMAFDPSKANFSGMNGRRDLFISAALHKAFADVNEEGTEAAAATGIVVGVTSLPPAPKEFRADHPFVILIRDNQTGGVLFVGRVANPKE